MNLDFEHSTKNLVPNETLAYLKGKSGNIILFGAGKSGDYFHELMNTHGIQAACYCDNSPQKQGTIKNSLPVYSYDVAILKYPDAAICITSCYSDEIQHQLQDRHDVFSVMNTCNWETANSCTKSDEEEFIRNHLKELNDVYNDILQDDKSKAVMQGILNYRLTRKTSYIAQIADVAGEYFDDSIITDKTRINSFIDGGAWTGDTLDSFISWKNGKYTHVYCFEAERNTSLLLKKYVSNKNYENVTVFNNALWNKTEKIAFFDSNGSGGGIA